MALARKDGSHPSMPGVLDGRQNAKLVVNHDVVIRGISPLNIAELALLVNVDEDVPIDRFEQTGALDLARLKDHVTVGEKDHRTPLAASLQRIEGVGIESIGKRIIRQKVGDRQKLRVSWVFDSVSLESAKIVGIAKLLAQFLKDCPVTLLSFRAHFSLEMPLEIGGYTVIVEQRVVHVKKRDYLHCNLISAR
jgi:hypothetical protein